MTEIAVYYQSPANDPLKIPRPHFVNLENRKVEGGEIGGNLLIVGIHPDMLRPTADKGYIDWFEIDTENPHQYTGWYIAFEQAAATGRHAATPDEPSIFTSGHKIDRIEVIHRKAKV